MILSNHVTPMFSGVAYSVRNHSIRQHSHRRIRTNKSHASHVTKAFHCHAVTQAFAYFMNICLFLQSYKRLFMPLQHTGFWISHPVHTAVSTHWHLDHRLRTPIRFFSPQGNKHLFCISFLCRYFEQQSSASERVTHELMYSSLS